MTQNDQVLLPIIMREVVTAISISGIQAMNFSPGTNAQIITILTELDNSQTLKSKKYPLFALVLPAPISRGLSAIYYGKVRIPRIVIAQINSWDGTPDVMSRYEAGGSFPDILYPCYYEFLKQLSWHPAIIEQDENSFEHTVVDHPGDRPLEKESNDFVDILEILDLEFTLIQNKTCS